MYNAAQLIGSSHHPSTELIIKRGADKIMVRATMTKCTTDGQGKGSWPPITKVFSEFFKPEDQTGKTALEE